MMMIDQLYVYSVCVLLFARPKAVTNKGFLLALMSQVSEYTHI